MITANHPDDGAHAGAAILIKSSIKYEESHILKLLVVSKLYVIKIVFRSVLFIFHHDFRLSCLLFKFFVADDFNPKGSELYRYIVNSNYYSVLSTGNPTYWPTDATKISDVLDFAVFSEISCQLLDIANIDVLSFDQLIATLNTTFEPDITKTIINGRTDLKSFSTWIERNINYNISLKTPAEIDDAVERLYYVIHKAGFLSTPKSPIQRNHNHTLLTSEITQLLLIKQRLRKRGLNSRDPNEKRFFNKAAKYLKIALYNMKHDQIVIRIPSIKKIMSSRCGMPQNI